MMRHFGALVSHPCQIDKYVFLSCRCRLTIWL